MAEGALITEKSIKSFDRKCESSKKSVKEMDLAIVVFHKICLEMGDILRRSMDLLFNPATNKRRDRKEVAAVLDLTGRNQRNYTGDKTATAIRECLTTFFGKKKNTKGLKKVIM